MLGIETSGMEGWSPNSEGTKGGIGGKQAMISEWSLFRSVNIGNVDILVRVGYSTLGICHTV